MTGKNDIKNTSEGALRHRSLASEMRALRVARQLRQADLARKAGVSRSTLSAFEQDGQGTVETLLRLLDGLGAGGGFEALLATLRAERESAGGSLEAILAEEEGARPVHRRVRRSA